MQIYGLDFTSAPGKRKPITCAECTFDGERLRLHAIEEFFDFAAFEAFLTRPGPWVAGMDFPFGQPRTLIDNLRWGDTWEQVIGSITALGDVNAFARTLAAYRATRAPGDKHHLRPIDSLAKSCSPMMMFGVPVGRMFFQGAPRLERSAVSIVPNRPNDDSRTVLEAYPALVARRWTAGKGYKSDEREKQSELHRVRREAIVVGLFTDCARHYGFEASMDRSAAENFVADPTGDRLDAFLCAVQTAWATTRRAAGWGVPADCDRREGWIVDPAMFDPFTGNRSLAEPSR